MPNLAIDPGTTHSAFVLYSKGLLLSKGYFANDELIQKLYDWSDSRDGIIDPGPTPPDIMVVEMIASYGMPVGKEVFETCVWIGRFIEAWQGPYKLMYRKDVKMALCGKTNAKDANIRQALIDLFGPKREDAVGTKKNPGPLYGVSGDIWAALAVAVAFEDKETILGKRI